MKILLFGISNVGKSTIGKQLSRKLGYDFDDLDEEIKRQYGKIDSFQSEYPFDYERHRKRGEILKEIIDKYDEQIKELTLLLLYLTSWTEKEPYGEYQRAWKGYDFDILNKLESEDMIGGSTYKVKSTYITEKGIEKAKELMGKYNIQD